MKSFILLLFFSSFFNVALSKEILVIDTDGGLDDYRAIILALKLENYQIKAIVCSDGTLYPTKSAVRVKQLLGSFDVKNIFIGTGRKTLRNKPLWRNFAESISWNYKNITVVDSVFPNAVQILNKIFDESENNSVTYLCLGSLNNLYETFQINPAAIKKIKKIIWYNSINIFNGTNYNFDPTSADYIFQNTSIPVFLVHNIENFNIYDDNFLKAIHGINSEYSRAILWQINNLKKTNNLHFLFGDEITVLYLIKPEAFIFDVHKDFRNVFALKLINFDEIKQAYINTLKSKFYIPVLFSLFYKDTILYKSEYRSNLLEIKRKHGDDELIYGAFTTELHGHLGIYSIIGVKMGIYAMELLGCKRFQVDIVSLSGKNQPLACINDGLMVATGAFPSYNRFKIDTLNLPGAIFMYNNKRLKLTLKNDIYEKIIKKEINLLFNSFGYSEKYWEELTKFSLEQWLKLDRNEIFDVEFLN